MNELFCERTFVDARWSILAQALRSQAGTMHAWRYSWNLALTLVPESSRERSGNMNFQLEEKHERQSFWSFKHLSGRNLKQLVCFAPGIACSGLKQATTGDAWGSILPGLLGLVWLISGSSKSFMKRTTSHALRVLSALFAVKPA